MFRNTYRKLIFLPFVLLLLAVLIVSCKHPRTDFVDYLNDISYQFHYRNLDSTRIFAARAYQAADGYKAGKAEALNNRAFVEIMQMRYKPAIETLDKVYSLTDNQVELLVADVQMMRLCQRQSKNKEFYDYQYRAQRRIKRINEELSSLPPRLRKRFIYAETEYHLTNSTYYYYVGLEQQSIDAIQKINPDGEIQSDRAQYLAYLYNIGAGGVITKGTKTQIAQTEFDYLVRCYMSASKNGYTFWEANALEAISEHIQQKNARRELIKDNMPTFKYLNIDNMPDEKLAGNFAERSLALFKQYGDVYQIAGAYRTLATCYWQFHDYPSAIICLQNALSSNDAIYQAPDLVASIREQLSVSFSAINDKQSSDYNRNIYLDLQEQTRQDRYYEARADQLNSTSNVLNWMIASIILLIIVFLILIIFFHRLRKRNDLQNRSLDYLLNPLKEWRKQDALQVETQENLYEEISEQVAISRLHVSDNKRKNLEQRTKISLVTSITPFIDRMLHEINALKTKQEPSEVQQERYVYIAELTDKINEYNNVLTDWIQLRQGKLALHIESFPIESVFDIVRKGRMAFQLRGIELDIQSSNESVKADKVLTLFMINTLADNARKFTPKGGKVQIKAVPANDYVEISVLDNGCGIPQTEIKNIFDRNLQPNLGIKESHGFGLMNCKGIINKYKKISQIFSVCDIGVESVEGKGSRFFFRLPKGIVRTLLMLFIFVMSFPMQSKAQRPATPNKEQAIKANDYLALANVYADSAYYSNIKGTYAKTLLFADSCRIYLNKQYKKFYPKGKDLMEKNSSGSGLPAEIKWFQQGFPTNYSVILDMRNESAVAALALHRWADYRYNNAIYTRLFKERSADSTLSTYCKMMVRSEANKNVAIILLILGLLSIFPAYYFLYYRHRLYYLYCEEQVKNINKILLSGSTTIEKQEKISSIVKDRFPEQLSEIVGKIQEALTASVNRDKRNTDSIDALKDELHISEYENDKLHVSNSILDNCLSTLKHETMYYPSRIQHLVKEPVPNLQNIDELAQYYKELYSILSMQAMKQVAAVKLTATTCHLSAIVERFGEIESGYTTDEVFADPDNLKLLFGTLYAKNKNAKYQISIDTSMQQYIRIHCKLQNLILSADQCRELFSPQADGLEYYICRQIVRENGEVSNKRGCGITAVPLEGGGTDILITVTRASQHLSMLNNKVANYD